MDDTSRAGALLCAARQPAVFRNGPDEVTSFSTLSEQIPFPTALLNHFGRIIFVNSAWCSQIGFASQYCIGRTVADFVDFDAGVSLDPDALSPQYEKPVEHVELPLADGAGNRLWFEYFAFRHQACIRVYLDPVGARREVEALREKLAVEENRQHFYSCVSHELRTSVHGVLGMAELLAETDLDPRQREYVELLCASGRHLSSMSSDLLNYSKMNSPMFQLSPAEIPLRDCLRGVVEAFVPLAAQKNVQLRGALDELPARAVCDATRIRQIFTNLIHNALKFTESGYISVGVASVRRIGQRHYELHCFVEDTGRGIPQDQLKHLFTPYWQGIQQDGAGLGLAICAQLVKLMGGHITVNSEVGIGSTVVFTLRVGVAGLC